METALNRSQLAWKAVLKESSCKLHLIASGGKRLAKMLTVQRKVVNFRAKYVFFGSNSNEANTRVCFSFNSAAYTHEYTHKSM